MLAMVGIVVPVLAGAQSVSPDVLRTPWGQPDLQGIWDFRTITPIERPDDLGEQAFLTEEEAAGLEQDAIDRDIRLWDQEARRTEAGGSVGGYNNFWMDRGTAPIETRRTSLIIDPPNGRLPGLSEIGRQRMEERRAHLEAHPADSYTDRNTSDRCIVGFNAGPPITPLAYNQNMQLFQTPDHVVVMTEMVHTTRVIPVDGRPGLDEGIRQWSGDSRGHWEGDTLVVETVNFPDHDAYSTWRGSSTDMKLVERFTRLDDATLMYEFTVTDPATWTRPWTANHRMQRNDLPMFEYACHEGNYSMDAMLGGARARERQAETGGQ